jgi:hypothetical protein
VNTPRGNFRIIEGVAEGAGFHLQRILDLVESMPAKAPFSDLRRSIDSLLKLSDAVAERAGVRQNALGQEAPYQALPIDLVNRLPAARELVRFSEADLFQLGIQEGSLAEFTFNPAGRSELRAQSTGNSNIERRPISVAGQRVDLLLPTAIAGAIIRFVIEWAIARGLSNAFETALGATIQKLLRETPVLGDRSRSRVEFERMDGGLIASMMREIDPGRFLHIVAFVDGLDGFLSDGFNGSNSNPAALSAALAFNLQQAVAKANSKPNFRGGLSLLVTCGYGRGFLAGTPRELPTNWKLEFIALHDMITLSWLRQFDALSLWKLLDARDAIEAQGIKFLNVNGLLNLVAWSEQLEGHLVPHGKLPDGFVTPGGSSIVVVPQNALRDLRHRVATAWAPLRVLDSDGEWAKVRKLGDSEFEEDNAAPLYVSEDDLHAGRLRAVYVAPERPWWIELDAPENSPRSIVYEHWRMLGVWLNRAAPVLDRSYSSLPLLPFSFKVRFAEILGNTNSSPKSLDENQIRFLLRVSAETGSSTVLIEVGEGYQEGFTHPHNLAERALVEAIVAGAAKAGGESLDIAKQARLAQEICPDPQARWIHRFEARSFRDYVGSQLNETPELIDRLDDGASRIGLGWKARPRERGPDISGVADCTSFLNDVVKVVLGELCESLHSLDRHAFASAILNNHEAASRERDVWERTSQANLALHNDKEAAVRTIVDHKSRLNACFVASRIVLEAAICECPLQGGRAPGKLDLSRTMASAMQAYNLGGWSDAIRWGAIEPRIRITPLGDVHIGQDFMDNIYEPFGRAVAEKLVKQAADSYEEIYETPKVVPTVTGLVEGDFLNAWQAEFGISMDALRGFLEKLEDKGRNPPSILLELPRSILVEMLRSAARISTEEATSTLGILSLVPRPVWRSVGPEFTDKDWAPWRFRRRLSVLRRPLIQIDAEADPSILIAPGLLREAVFFVAGSYYSGAIPSTQARSAAMSKWIGQANNEQRTKFNLVVANRMKELGWDVEREIKLTKILEHHLDRDYGDIDVLAWNRESGRVLIMECKDLQFQKTLGEIAEQLSDFRGELGSDGKPDLLKRHLDRVKRLTANTDLVSKKLRLAAPIQMTGHLVFKNPVPIRYAKEQIASRTELTLFSELDEL